MKDVFRKKPQFFRVALLVLLAMFCMGRVYYYWEHASEIANNMKLENGRSNDWVEIARCAKKTGQIFVLCDHGPVQLAEEIDQADDRGHSLLISIWSFFQNRPVELLDLVRINLLINVIGILALTWLFWLFKMELVSLFLVVTGFAFGLVLEEKASDVVSASLGIYCLVISTTLTMLYLIARKRQGKPFVGGLVYIFLALSWASLLRQSIALGGVATILLSLFFCRKFYSNIMTWKKFGAFLLIVGISAFVIPSNILYLRPALGGPPVSHKKVTAHGFSHALYLGLGTEANPWGIVWNDWVAEQNVRKLEPDIIYLSDHYFDTIRSMYFKILMNDPLTVTRIYLSKAVSAIDNICRHQWGLLSIGFFIYLICLRISWHRWKDRLFLDYLLLDFAVTLPIFFVVLLGVLANPHKAYYFDFASICLGLILFVALNSIYVMTGSKEEENKPVSF